MNQNKKTSAVSDAEKAPAKITLENSGLIFRPATSKGSADGIYSPWPKAVVLATEAEVPTSTAAKGDDGLMSTPAKPVKA